MNKKKFLAGLTLAAGLAITPSADFNRAAAQNTAPDLSLGTATIQDTAQDQAQKNSQLLGVIDRLHAYLLSDANPGRTDPAYKAGADPVIVAEIQNLISLLRAGADADHIDPATGVSAFAHGLWMAYELDRPDIVREFLRHGADPRGQFPGTMPLLQAQQNFHNVAGAPKIDPAKNIAIMDQAAFAVLESQNLYLQGISSRTHVMTALAILKDLRDAGATLDDALQLPDRYSEKGYASLAMTAFSLFMMQEGGLIAAQDTLDYFGLSQQAMATINGRTTLDRTFLESLDAPIVDFTDAYPGGDEPYTVGDGDTLRGIAERFRGTIPAQDGKTPLQILAKHNDIALDDPVHGDALLAAGTKLMLPTAETVQIGYRIAPTPLDALRGLAMRMLPQMNAPDVGTAMNMIIRENELRSESDLSKLLESNQSIQIPTLNPDGTPGAVIETAITPRDSVISIVESVRENFYRRDAGFEEVLEELARMNGTSAEAVLAGAWPVESCQPVNETLEGCKTLIVPYANDNFSHRRPMTPPATYDPDHAVYRIIIEGDGVGNDPSRTPGYHQKRTYGVSTTTSYAINRDVDFSRFFAWNEQLFGYPSPQVSQALTLLMNLADSPLRDRVVFSHSMATAMPEQAADRYRLSRSNDAPHFIEARYFLDRLEKSAPIIFLGAGNYRLNTPGSTEGEGRYVQSYLATHSPRAVNIGAVGSYPAVAPADRLTISPYSSYAADVCTVLPPFISGQQEGTSFATPETQALYAQFAEWYGNILTFEEIWGVAMMTADRNILEYDERSGAVAGSKENPRAVDTPFRTNGAGLPYHERCGAGAINAERWREMLDHMVVFKQQLGAGAPELRSDTIAVSAPTRIRTASDGGKIYTYRIPVPRDMTLGKLTLLLPQMENAHSEIIVRSPAGFRIHLPKSHLTDIISTSAFNYEDVEKGDFIEITTGQPLGEGAGIVLRGHDDGNTLQMMRDYLRGIGMLPAPLRALRGERDEGRDPGIGRIDLTPPVQAATVLDFGVIPPPQAVPPVPR